MWLALRIYAGVCTLLVTAYLALALWSAFFAKSSPVMNETSVMSSYGEYVAKEYPKRGDYFWRLAMVLGVYSKATSVPATDILKYLGKPDLLTGTAETGTLVYLYEYSGATNRWAVYATLTNGKLTQVGFNDATVNDRSGFQAYPTQ
jgi:hypothetical protein